MHMYSDVHTFIWLHTQIYGVTKPQRVESLWHSDAIYGRGTQTTLVQEMACRLFSTSCQYNHCAFYAKWNPRNILYWHLNIKPKRFHYKTNWKCSFQFDSHFVSTPMRQLPVIIKFQITVDQVNKSPEMSRMKLVIHSETSAVVSLRLENGSVASSTFYDGCNYLFVQL